ncbi:YfjI family protein, partial [Sansalvadorimonas sp. 2012CJ34-2]|nr:YfjI family protein [Sansalvadorimonas sp. 2012CJ34-2]
MANNSITPDQNIKLLPAPNAVEAPNITWEKPKPIEQALLPVMKFDPLWLPSEIRDWVVDIAERKDNAPVEFAAIAVICALATVIGNRLVIAPKAFDDWVVIPNLWGAAIGRPSIKKTPVMQEAISFLMELERVAGEEHEKAMQEYEEKKIKSDLLLDAAKGEFKKAGHDIQKRKDAELHLNDAMNEIPEVPIRSRYTTSDSTVEKLAVLMSENPMGILQVRDELFGLLAQLAKADKTEYRPFYLE